MVRPAAAERATRAWGPSRPRSIDHLRKNPMPATRTTIPTRKSHWLATAYSVETPSGMWSSPTMIQFQILRSVSRAAVSKRLGSRATGRTGTGDSTRSTAAPAVPRVGHACRPPASAVNGVSTRGGRGSGRYAGTGSTSACGRPPTSGKGGGSATAAAGDSAGGAAGSRLPTSDHIRRRAVSCLAIRSRCRLRICC